ncbi:MAG: PAS domain-containing protein [Sphingomonadaceae bacterium]|nr:PAS domain-containing protein [Sphingomonadaceae bacterium]
MFAGAYHVAVDSPFGPPAPKLEPLRETLARVQLAMEAANIGVWDWNIATREILYCRICRSLYGLPMEGPIDHEDVAALVHPEDLPRVRALHAEAVERHDEAPIPAEYRIRHGRTREERWLSAFGRLQFEGTRAVRCVGTLQDVTEERRLARENRAYLERLTFAMRAGRLGSFERDVQRDVVRWDDAMCAIFGAEPEQAPHSLDTIWKFIVPEDQHILREAIVRGLARGEGYTVHYRIRRPDGETRHIRHTSAIITDAAGRLTHNFGYVVDVTDLRRAEQVAAERQAILNGVFEAAGLMVGVIAMTDDGFEFVERNANTSQFLRVPHDDRPVTTRDCNYTPDETLRARTRLLDVLARGTTVTQEFEFHRSGDGEQWWLGTHKPLGCDERGRPRLAYVVQEITERKIAEERQRLLMREVDHRAKNALAVAQAVVMLTRADEPKAFKEAVTGRVSAIARAHSLLAEDRWRGVDLERLICEELAPFTVPGGPAFTVSGPRYQLNASIAQSMGLILHELATNAAKYGALSREGGRLSVAWRAAAGGELSFEWREDAPWAEPPPPERRGFGMKLLDQTIRRQLGGSWDSTWRPQGLRFTMDLPPVDAPAGRENLVRPRADAPIVLVAEDEPLIALEIEAALAGHGFQVLGPLSSADAAAHAARQAGRIDAAVLDISLGGDTSLALAHELSGRGARVLFCSGYEVGAVPGAPQNIRWMVKPVSGAAVARVVADMLRAATRQPA